MSFEDLNIKETRVSQCRFQKEFAALEQKDRDLLVTAFTNPEITTSYIYRVVSENGFPVSESTIRTHRRGNCRTCGTIG